MPSQVITEQQTESPANYEVPVDHGRLRYVTSLLGSQQGLNTALVGTLLFFVNTWEILDWPGWWGLLAWVAGVAGLRIYCVAFERWVPDYYERRFGTVQPAQKPWSKWGALGFLALVVLLVIGWPVAHYFGPVASSLLGRLHMMISDPARQISLSPSLLWMLLLCRSLRCPMSGIERQRLYFQLVGMVGFASIVSFAIWHPDAKQLVWWKVLNAGGLGLSFIAVGLYDHISLVLLLPKRVEEGDDE